MTDIETILEALLTELDRLAARVGEGWQPIETAPNEGKFLAFWPGGGEWRVPPVGIRLTWRFHCGGGSIFTGYDVMGPDPTHWRPLPPPPEAKDE